MDFFLYSIDYIQEKGSYTYVDTEICDEIQRYYRISHSCPTLCINLRSLPQNPHTKCEKHWVLSYDKLNNSNIK